MLKLNRKDQRSTQAWISAVAGRKMLYILWLLLIQVSIGLLSVAIPLSLKNVINMAAKKDLHAFTISTTILACVVAGQVIFRAMGRFMTEYTQSTMENCFKTRLFAILLKRDYAQVTAVHSGEWMNRLTSDTVVVAEGLTQVVPSVTGMLAKLIGSMAAVMVMIPGLIYLIVPGGLLLAALAFIFRKALKQLHKQMQASNGRLRAFLVERLTSLMVVRAYAREKQTVAEAASKIAEYHQKRMRKNRFAIINTIGFATAMRGTYLAGAIYCGYGILNGTMSFGSLTAVVQLLGQLQSPFANVTGYIPKYFDMLASAERLMEAESYAVDDSDAIMSTCEARNFYTTTFRTIALCDAVFTYRARGDANDSDKADMPVVIKHIDLTIQKGAYIAFTGPSGCGKSTLLKLLLCLYPLDGGTREITLTSGESIPLTNLYRRLFAYVPQGNQVMSGTIRQIITFDEAVNCDDEAIWRALRVACADDFVRELPDSLDTVLGERGTGLSEGQMQRIAIARAIYSGNPILMLDESTSALDEQTERRLIDNLRTMTDRTVLIVTHRPAALAICDRQVKMTDNGVEAME